MTDPGILRDIPSVDDFLGGEWGVDMSAFPRPLLRRALNEVLDALRAEVLQGDVGEIPPTEELMDRTREAVQRKLSPALKPLVNATGVVVHTNLGRSLLCRAAAEAVVASVTAYTDLEYDLETGGRGGRYRGVADLLRELTGAEDILLVNNNAAAVLLCLATLAADREVVVSRGELVEIGGSFRIPDVMAASGAHLAEVGTTNRTHRADYEGAIGDQTAALMKVHASNYRIVGFVSEVSIGEMSELANSRRIPVIYDMGSGIMSDLGARGIDGENTVADAIGAGAHIVTFSGDKLLGGPQVGIIAGEAKYIGQMKRHPLLRALRVDKMTISALDATLKAFLLEQEWETIPTLRFLGADPTYLAGEAEALAGQLRSLLPDLWPVTTLPDSSPAGGGALPGVDLPTTLVEVVPPQDVEKVARLLRENDPPIIPRIRGGSLMFDPRTMLSGDDEKVLEAFRRILRTGSGGGASRGKRSR